MGTMRIPAAVAALTMLAGCGASKEPKVAEAPAPKAAQYDAKAFFTTTAFGLASGYAWSPDDKELLVHSDETGIFNAYALSANGEAKRALTSSTTDSTFAVSWFPDDARVLFQADKGGNEINHLFVRELVGESARPDARRQGEGGVRRLVRGQASPSTRRPTNAIQRPSICIAMQRRITRARCSSATTTRSTSRPCRRTAATRRS